MTNSPNKPTIVFWIISIFSLIWNLMGVAAYLAQAYMSDEVLVAMPEAERTLIENTPSWVTAAFAIAVFGGALGCLLMVLRKKIATVVLAISLVGILAQMVYNFMLSKTAESYGAGGMIMPAMIVIIGFFLVWYSKKSTAKGWLL